MNFVIGDIHGELAKLKLLLKNIFAIDDSAKLIFIGDYIDKGTDAYSTLKYLSKLSHERECVFLRGNHEYNWELLKDKNDKYAEFILKFGGQNTISSINEKLSVLETKELLFTEFKSFFDSLNNYYVINNYVITHSGIPPELFSVKIENIEAHQLLFNRYNFISSEKLYFGKKIIFGHTGFYSPYYDGYKIGIDTSAYFLDSQPLTAFCVDQDFFIDSKNNRTELLSINQSCCPAIPRVKS